MKERKVHACARALAIGSSLVALLVASNFAGSRIALSDDDDFHALMQARQFSSDQISSLSPAAPTHLESDDMATAPTTDTMGDSLRVQGNAETVQLDVHHKTIGYVLSALAVKFNNRSSSALNEELNGRYTGSPEQVLSRVLGGYDFVIKRDNFKLSVTIFRQHQAQIRTSRP
jgi:hypothetical protein